MLLLLTPIYYFAFEEKRILISSYLQEPLFDTSDLRSIKSDDISMQTQCYGKSGSIEISLLYDAPMRKMTVHVLQVSHTYLLLFEYYVIDYLIKIPGTRCTNLGQWSTVPHTSASSNVTE